MLFRSVVRVGLCVVRVGLCVWLREGCVCGSGRVLCVGMVELRVVVVCVISMGLCVWLGKEKVMV